MKKSKYGYCGLTADPLHIGHIKYLKECKSMCEILIVGIMTDECVEQYKGKAPIMSQKERREMVSSLRMVDRTQYQTEFEFTHDVMRCKNFYKDDYIIFDSTEHDRQYADVIIKRYSDISSTQYRKESHESSNNSKC